LLKICYFIDKSIFRKYIALNNDEHLQNVIFITICFKNILGHQNIITLIIRTFPKNKRHFTEENLEFLIRFLYMEASQSK
jgi:hypothetical protein